MSSPNHHRIDTTVLSWALTDQVGVESKVLRGGIALYRLAAGTAPPRVDAGSVAELLVLEGSLEGSLKSPQTTLPSDSYAVRRTMDDCAAGPEGCTLFLRIFIDTQGATEEVHCASAGQPWLPGQGGLRVKPLGDSSALVHWPANERFVPHKHWGGEEIFVLSGTFRDEHGVYPTGTWLQNPHLSAHHPFVLEETVIWVKTGHLHPDAPPR